jgi:L-fuconolactonase
VNKKQKASLFAMMLLLVLLMSSCSSRETTEIPIVDCHVHLWDVSRPDPQGRRWPRKEHKEHFINYMPKTHYDSIAHRNNVHGVVVVQSGQALEDNQWNLDITAYNKDLYRGLVGNLSRVIGTDDFKPLFDKLCQDERYKGYRLSGKYQEKLTDAFYRDLAMTAARGKTVDFLVGGYKHADVVKIAKRLPKLKIIVNHFASVQLNGGPLDPTWVKQFKALAECKNVYCKVSALYGRVKKQPATKDIKYYTPVLDLALENFGEDRLIYGSDWPVTILTGDYASVVKLMKAYFDGKGRRVSEKLFYKNAQKFYNIKKVK